VVLHLVPRLPPALPAVTARDIEQAWEATRPPIAAPPRAFRFAGDTPLELQLTERAVGLHSLHGISVCLRLLALIALLAQSLWARRWFTLAREGVTIHPDLLRAASVAPLNASGGFDEPTIAALMPCAASGV
jgi:hypothetical protein